MLEQVRSEPTLLDKSNQGTDDLVRKSGLEKVVYISSLFVDLHLLCNELCNYSNIPYMLFRILYKLIVQLLLRKNIIKQTSMVVYVEIMKPVALLGMLRKERRLIGALYPCIKSVWIDIMPL